jgi:hypothetical protein
MSMRENQLFETALSLPQSDRADLAAEIHDRVAAHRRGDIQSHSLEETRAIMKERLSRGDSP